MIFDLNGVLVMTTGNTSQRHPTAVTAKLVGSDSWIVCNLPSVWDSTWVRITVCKARVLFET